MFLYPRFIRSVLHRRFVLHGGARLNIIIAMQIKVGPPMTVVAINIC